MEHDCPQIASAKDGNPRQPTTIYSRSMSHSMEHFKKSYLNLIDNSQSDDFLVFIFVDADNLKTINDRLGHIVGDRFIEIVGSLLLKLLPIGSITYRKGGDEFIASFSSKDIEIAENYITTIINSINGYHIIEGHKLFISCSAGVDISHISKANLKCQMQRADTALYTSKKSGKGKVTFFDLKQCSNILVVNELSENFSSVLENDDLSILLQPIFRIDNRAIESVEALVRWKHPVFGDVCAKQIVDIARQGNYLEEFGLMVLRRAAFIVSSWPSQISLNVNFCAEDFYRINFSSSVLSILDEAGLSNFRLNIEITDIEKLVNSEAARSNILLLRSKGVQIGINSVDSDFTKFKAIEELPIDFLKIDRSLISGCNYLKNNKIIISAIIRIAKELQIFVIATGVESVNEAAIVRGLGIKFSQGFYFGKPMAKNNIDELVNTRKYDLYSDDFCRVNLGVTAFPCSPDGLSIRR